MPAWGHVAFLVTIPWRWLPSFEVGPLERETEKAAAPIEKHERAPERTTLTPTPAPARVAVIPDEVVLRTLESGRSAFLGCWKRALKADPMLDAMKIKLRVEIDEFGQVLSVTHDSTSEKLGNCLSGVARSLSYALPPARAVAEFPLFFQPE
jgi:hypothetical protein